MERQKLSAKDLFDLVSKMTKAEKKFFYQNNAMHNTSAYIRLYQAIQKQRSYNKDELLKLTDIPIEQFRNQKKYLYEALLKSLDAFHADKSVHAQLKHYILRIQMLINKGLYSQAAVLLKQGQKLAEEHQRFIELVEFSQLEKQIQAANSFAHYTPEMLMILHEKEKYNLSHIEQEIESWNVSIKTYLLGTKSGIRDSSYLEEMERFRLTISSKNARLAGSYIAQLHWYSALCNYYSSQGDWKELYAYRRRILKVFEQNSFLIEDYLHRYVVALYNFLVACFNLSRFGKDFNHHHAILSRVPEKYKGNNAATEDLNNRVYTFATSIRLAMLIRTEQKKAALSFVQDIIPELEKYETNMNRYMKLNLYYNISLAYFFNNMLELAQRWIDRLMGESETYTGDQFQIFARIYNLIINYERGNFFLFEYMARSARHYIRRRHHEFEYEKALIKFFKTINKYNIKDPVYEKQAFTQLKKQFKEILKNPRERKAMSYFDFMKWFDGKIKGRAL